MKINENELEKLLLDWFNETDLSKIHFWNRNKIGKLIKSELNKIGKWRNRARGNPYKGYKIMKEKSKQEFNF